MAASISSWNTDVARYVKGIENSAFTTLLDNEIHEVLRDFCRETDIWSVFLTKIDVETSVAAYLLSTENVDDPMTAPDESQVEPSDGWAQVQRIEQAWFKDDGESDDQYALIFPITDWREDERGLYWRATPGVAPLKYHHRIEDSKILLDVIPTVDSDGGLLVKVSLRPAPSSTKVPSFIYDRWKRGITYGIAGGLMMMSNKPWTDLQTGEVYWGKYLAQREDAFQMKQLGANRMTVNPVSLAVEAMGVGSRQRTLLF